MVKKVQLIPDNSKSSNSKTCCERSRLVLGGWGGGGGGVLYENKNIHFAMLSLSKIMVKKVQLIPDNSNLDNSKKY